MLPGDPRPKQYHDVGCYFPLHGTRYVEGVLIRRNVLHFSTYRQLNAEQRSTLRPLFAMQPA